jgi:hypothetical protein
MLDKIFAIIGMLALVAFMGVVTVFVMEPDLWFITILVLAIGVIFFVRELKELERHTILIIGLRERPKRFGMSLTVTRWPRPPADPCG